MSVAEYINYIRCLAEQCKKVEPSDFTKSKKNPNTYTHIQFKLVEDDDRYNEILQLLIDMPNIKDDFEKQLLKEINLTITYNNFTYVLEDVYSEYGIPNNANKVRWYLTFKIL